MAAAAACCMDLLYLFLPQPTQQPSSLLLFLSFLDEQGNQSIEPHEGWTLLKIMACKT